MRSYTLASWQSKSTAYHGLLMARSTREWFGKTDDSPIPPRVKLRVKVRANDCCQICGIRVYRGGEIDHIEPVINSTPQFFLNRESNLRFLCRNCHSAKTAKDVKQKSADAKTQKHMAGFKPKGRTFWKPEKPKKELSHGQWDYTIDPETKIIRGRWISPKGD